MSVLVHVGGMHCAACAVLVRETLVEAGLAETVTVDLARGTAVLTGSPPHPDLPGACHAVLAPLGYTAGARPASHGRPGMADWLLSLGAGAAVLGIVIALGSLTGGGQGFLAARLTVPGAAILGALASVSTCFALVGGIIAAFTTALSGPPGRPEPAATSRLVLGLGAFHGARLAGFFALGAVLGLVGDILQPDYTFQLAMLGLAALLMVAFGLQSLGLVHLPVLGKSTTRTGMRGLPAINRSRLTSVGTGILLGAGTFFLPCGITQSVQFQALATAEPLQSGLLCLSFALGTLPVLLLASFGLGMALRSRHGGLVARASGFLLVGLGLYQAWTAVQVSGIFLPAF